MLRAMCFFSCGVPEVSRRCGDASMEAVEHIDAALALSKAYQLFCRHGWTPVGNREALSRRKQGFESPRERHIEKSITYMRL